MFLAKDLKVIRSERVRSRLEPSEDLTRRRQARAQPARKADGAFRVGQRLAAGLAEMGLC
jgi:hypothetical protein